MRLEEVDLIHVRRRLPKPFRISVGAVSAREFIVLRGRGEGFTVYGEVNVDLRPFYTDEYIASAWDVISHDLLPSILNKEIASARDVQAHWKHVRGHHFAKAAIEALFWDLEGKIKDVSIATLIGGCHTRLQTGTSHSIFPTVEDLLVEVEEAVATGIPRVKLKIQPGWDYEPLAAVRRRFPEILLMGDANAAYPAANPETLSSLQRLDSLNLCMVEQPFAHFDLISNLALKKCSSTPLCLDESLHDLELVKSAIAFGAIDIVNIKVGRVGGLSESLSIRDHCRSLGIPLWCGRRTGSGISIALELAMASLPEFTYPTDHGIDFLHETLDPLVEMSQFDYRDGTLAVPEKAGLGIEVGESLIKRATVHSETIR